MSWSNPVALDLHHSQNYQSRGETQTPHWPGIPVRPSEGLQGTATREAVASPLPWPPPPQRCGGPLGYLTAGCHFPSGW